MKQTEDHSISNMNTIGREDNSFKSPPSAPKIKNAEMLQGVYKLMMNQDFNNVDFEDLQRFLSKLSSVKKTVKKLYDKQVMVLIKQHKAHNEKNGNRFFNKEMDDEESVTSSEDSVGIEMEKPPILNVNEQN